MVSRGIKSSSLHVRLIGGYHLEDLNIKATSSLSVALSLEQRRHKSKQALFSPSSDAPFAAPLADFSPSPTLPPRSAPPLSSLSPLWGDSFSFIVTSPLSSLFVTLYEHPADGGTTKNIGEAEVVLATLGDGKATTMRVDIKGKEREKNTGWAFFAREEESNQKTRQGQKDQMNTHGLELRVEFKFSAKWGPIYDALQACAEGDARTANEMLTMAIDDPSYEIMPPYFGVLLCNRSLCRVRLGQFDLAVEDAKLSLEVDESVGEDAYFIVGLAFESSGQLTRALSAYSDGMRYVRDVSTSQLAERYRRLKKEEESESPSKRFAQMYAMEAAEKKDFETAEKHISSLISLTPNEGYGYLGRALVRSRASDAAGAGADVREALRLDPNWFFRDTDYEGILEKRGEGTLSIYRTRYFRLKGRFLLYYTVSPNGFIILATDTRITSRDNRPLEFQIVLPTRTYEIRAESESVSTDWIQVLLQAISSDLKFPENPKAEQDLPANISSYRPLSPSQTPQPISSTPSTLATSSSFSGQPAQSSPKRHSPPGGGRASPTGRGKLLASSSPSSKKTSPSKKKEREREKEKEKEKKEERGNEKPLLSRVDSLYPALFGSDRGGRVVKRDLRSRVAYLQKSMDQWTESDVQEWASAKLLDDAVLKAFTQHHIDGPSLSSLSLQSLRCELGILPYGLRKRIVEAIEKDGGRPPFSLDCGEFVSHPGEGQLRVRSRQIIIDLKKIPENERERLGDAILKWRAAGPSYSIRLWEAAIEVSVPGAKKITKPLTTIKEINPSTTHLHLFTDPFQTHLLSLISFFSSSPSSIISTLSSSCLSSLSSFTAGSSRQQEVKDLLLLSLRVAEQFQNLEKSGIFPSQSWVVPIQSIVWDIDETIVSEKKGSRDSAGADSERDLAVGDIVIEDDVLEVNMVRVVVLPLPLFLSVGKKEEERETSCSDQWEFSRLFTVKRWGSPELLASCLSSGGNRNSSILSPFSSSSSSPLSLSWNCGAILWSLFSGVEPFSEYSNEQIMGETLNYKFAQPDKCPSDVFAVIKGCLETEPLKRASLSAVVAKLAAIRDSKGLK